MLFSTSRQVLTSATSDIRLLNLNIKVAPIRTNYWMHAVAPKTVCALGQIWGTRKIQSAGPGFKTAGPPEGSERLDFSRGKIYPNSLASQILQPKKENLLQLWCVKLLAETADGVHNIGLTRRWLPKKVCPLSLRAWKALAASLHCIYTQ